MPEPVPLPLPLPLIEAVGASKFYGPIAALRDLSLRIHADQPSITAVVGESGSGKTTLARMILGLTSPSSGKVLYKGHDLQRLDASQRLQFRHDLQAIFQDPYEVYNPFYRVDHVLTTPAAKFRLAPTKAGRRELIEDALRAVGLRPEEILGRFPHQLSGGQRQRIMVARALLLRPKLIVADEPVSMVDASLRATILGSLRKLTEENGISIIYITHDLATAYQVSDNVLVMYRAGVAEAGYVEHVVKAPLHPYTQLLVASIPQVSTTRDWLAPLQPQDARPPPAALNAASCSFVDRCPAAMPRCAAAVPPLFRAAEHQAASCFLHQDAPVLEGGVDRVMTQRAAPTEVAVAQ